MQTCGRAFASFVAMLSLPLALSLGACDASRGTESAADPTATPQARKVIGQASDYVPATLTAEAENRVRTSMLARRQFAWELVAKALAPVATHAGALQVPRWATWYAQDDLQRLFQKLYADLGKDGRRARQPFAAAALADAMQWNTRMVEQLPSWPAARYEAWLATLDDGERVHSLTGLQRTLLAPATLDHILRNYPEINACLDRVADVPFPDPGLADDNFSRCYQREFAPAAAVVKTAWVREGLGFKVGAFDTSAAGLERRLGAVAGSWETPDAVADPEASTIYVQELDQGARFRLAGLHLMTKELREWVWITLWWSDTPDADFGADRPESIRRLGGPWSNYKMCVVTGFDDDAVDGDAAELQARYPSLGAALAAAQAAVGPSSWCSNPFIEAGAGNHRSNCIGCHQHAGSAFGSAEILSDPTRFPAEGRQRVRENFPADYLWSFNKDPERWAHTMRNVITQYDVFDLHVDQP